MPLGARSVKGDPALLLERDLALAERLAATGTEIFIKVFVRQNQKQAFPHRHRLGAFAAIESGCLEGFKLFHVNRWYETRPDPTRASQ